MTGIIALYIFMLAAFAGWVIKCAARGHSRAAPVRFAEVRLSLPSASVPTPGLEVRLVDGTVARGTNAGELAALVRALRS